MTFNLICLQSLLLVNYVCMPNNNQRAQAKKGESDEFWPKLPSSLKFTVLCIGLQSGCHSCQKLGSVVIKSQCFQQRTLRFLGNNFTVPLGTVPLNFVENPLILANST